MSAFYRVIKILITPIFKWLLPIKVIGRENLPKEGGFILASNHTSISDPIFMIANFRRQVNFMAKAELFKNRIFRFVLSHLGAFAVDRGKGDMSAIHHAADLIRDGKILGIFPEGTRYVEGAPRKAKSGVAYIAMDTKSDILPVSIYREGKYKVFKKTTIRIGELIKYEDLIDSELTDRANLRRIVDKVTTSITDLWEMKH